MNRTWRVIRRAGVYFGAASLAAGLACTSRRAVEPEPRQYRIYVAAADFRSFPSRNMVYVYDADELVLQDSLAIFGNALDLAVLPDGQSLLLQLEDISNLPDVSYPVVRYDLRTWLSSWAVGGNGSEVCVLKDGAWFLNGNDVRNAADGSLIRRLADSLNLKSGPMSGTEVAATIPDSVGVYVVDTIITVVDAASGELRGQYIPRVSTGQVLEVWHAQLHPDKVRVLAIGRSAPYQSWLVIGNTQTGTTVFELSLVYPYGRVAISEDGGIAVVTDPSKPEVWDSPATVDVVDLAQLVHLKRFTWPDDIYRAAMVEFVSDDGLFVTAPYYSGPLQLFDLKTLTVIDTVFLPFPGAVPTALGAGQSPR